MNILIYVSDFHPFCFQQCPRPNQSWVEQGLLTAQVRHNLTCTPLAHYQGTVHLSWAGRGSLRARDQNTCPTSISSHSHGCVLTAHTSRTPVLISLRLMVGGVKYPFPPGFAERQQKRKVYLGTAATALQQLGTMMRHYRASSLWLGSTDFPLVASPLAPPATVLRVPPPASL